MTGSNAVSETSGVLGAGGRVAADPLSDLTSVAAASGTLPQIPAVEKFQQAAGRLQNQLVDENPLVYSNYEQLSKNLVQFQERLQAAQAFSRSLADLPGPASGRDFSVAEPLLPLTILALTRQAGTDNSTLLYNLYCKTHLDEDGIEARIVFPEWMKHLHPHIVINPDLSKLPDHSAYLRCSEALAPQLQEIETRLEDKNVQLGKLKELNAKGKGGSYSDAIENIEQDIKAIKAEVPVLFERITDVLPEQVTEAMGALSLKTSVAPEFLKAVVKTTVELEAMLVAILDPESQRSGQALSLPKLGQAGDVREDRFTLELSHLAQIRQDPALLTQLLNAYLNSRVFLRGISAEIKDFPELADQAGAVLQVLRQPFSSDSARGRFSINNLITIDALEVKQATLALINDPIFVSAAGKASWGHTLEDAKNLKPLLWVVRNYLQTPGSSRSNPYHLVLQRSPELSSNLLGFLERTHQALEVKDYEGLAKVITDEIRSAGRSENFFKLYAALAVLPIILENPETQEKLKNQIADVDQLKNLLESISRINPAVKSEVNALISTAVKGLSYSMADFYREPGMEDLWDFIDKFKLFMANPKALEGLAGNEGMESGILVAGEPGVGKTHFVKCIQNELNIKMFKISPDQADTGSINMMTEACKTIIKQAIKYSEETGHCILFIDEAEAIMANRDRPGVSSEKVDLTCYLLQAINDLREKHPKILVIAATNYPDRIDEGMYRDGRFDVRVYMGMPGPGMRRSIINETLGKEKIPLRLTEPEMQEILAITDGFLPIALKRTIHQLSRFGKLQATAESRNFEVTAAVLKAAYERLRGRRQVSLIERMEQEREKRQVRPAGGAAEAGASAAA